MTHPAPLRVLYVEDDRVSALLFGQALLAETRIELCIAEDGAEALLIAAAWPPEVLVLDAHLPDTDGHALLQALRALPGLAQVPAIMCSADSEPEDLQRARQSGFIGYWVKPLGPDQARTDLLALLDGPAGR
ncbi:MAG: response regulator [Aquabacterium sp.]|nr:response regulator [Aquabacterium sp.]